LQSAAATAIPLDRMLKLLLPVSAKGMDWMYAYDPRAA
jgi:hypothetical protein